MDKPLLHEYKESGVMLKSTAIMTGQAVDEGTINYERSQIPEVITVYYPLTSSESQQQQQQQYRDLAAEPEQQSLAQKNTRLDSREWTVQYLRSSS
ncbi:hypothetical protein F2P81_013595 [Scophthalmus maximus]|uniref:Uncharacterized protein n=1 Tax=Scophthalmus maximus TaxID=52904 RepID=A0A6A4SLN7_SCOMX|nr:hypothetical protein F2P81_013595 [Scophthalmus maximus]